MQIIQVEQLHKIPFSGGYLYGQEHEGRIFASLRKACQSIGIDFSPQRRKLARANWATVIMMTTVADDGKARQHAMIDHESLPLWLATINPKKVDETAREMIELYQREAKRVLADYFLRKTPAVPQPVAPSDPIEALLLATLENKRQLDAIQQTLAQLLPSKAGEPLLTPTQIGSRLDPAESPQSINKRLVALGLQVKRGGDWVLTEEGEKWGHAHAVPVDDLGNTRPHIKWRQSLVERIQGPKALESHA